MTPKQLLRAMEMKWRRHGCANPLRPVGWIFEAGRLIPYDDSLFADEDEGYPVRPETPFYTGTRH